MAARKTAASLSRVAPRRGRFVGRGGEKGSCGVGERRRGAKTDWSDPNLGGRGGKGGQIAKKQ